MQEKVYNMYEHDGNDEDPMNRNLKRLNEICAISIPLIKEIRTKCDD